MSLWPSPPPPCDPGGCDFKYWSASTAAKQPAQTPHLTVAYSFPVTHRHLPRRRALPVIGLLLMALHTLSAPEAHGIACAEPETSNSTAARWPTCTNAASMGSAMTFRLTTPLVWLSSTCPMPLMPSSSLGTYFVKCDWLTIARDAWSCLIKTFHRACGSRLLLHVRCVICCSGTALPTACMPRNRTLSVSL